MRTFSLIALTTVGCFIWSVSALSQEDDLFGDVLSLEELLNTQISTVSKYKQTASEAPASVEIVTSEDIARHGYRTLADVLYTVRGVQLAYDHGYYFVGSRGVFTPISINNHVLLLLNNQPMNESVLSASLFGNGFPIDMNTVERIEIVRGPGSILYGTNAMFLVVNVVTKTGNRLAGPTATVDYGTGNEKTVSASYGTTFSTDAAATLSVRMSDSDGEDYFSQEYDATAVGADWERFNTVMGTMTYGGLKAHALFYSRRKGIPTGGFGARFGDPRSFTFDERIAAQAEYERQLGATTRVDVRAFYHDTENSSRVVNAFVRPQRHRATSATAGSEARFLWDIRADNRLTVGAEYQDHFETSMRSGTDDGSTFFDGDQPFRVFSVYAVDDYQVRSNFRVSLGVRHDQHSEANSSATVPRGALIYQPFDTSTFKLLYGEAFRAPTLIERDFRLPFALAPNPNIRPERVRTIEAIWEQRVSDGYFVTASVFHNDVTDLIVAGTPSLGVAATFDNIGEALVTGVELEMWAHLASGLDAYASYGFYHTESAATQKELTYAPKHVVKFGASTTVLGSAIAAFDGRYNSSMFTNDSTDATPRRTLDGSVVANVSLTTSPIMKWLTLRARVDNVLDTEYREPIAPYTNPLDKSFVLDSALQDGRQFVVSATARF